MNIPSTLLDNNGYPTDEFLKFIEEYDPKLMPIMDFIDVLRDGWHSADRHFKIGRKYRGKRKLELHTGGWSGNEQTIRAIKENIYLTNFCMSYVMWKTGGHYYFEITC